MHSAFHLEPDWLGFWSDGMDQNRNLLSSQGYGLIEGESVSSTVPKIISLDSGPSNENMDQFRSSWKFKGDPSYIEGFGILFSGPKVPMTKIYGYLKGNFSGPSDYFFFSKRKRESQNIPVLIIRNRSWYAYGTSNKSISTICIYIINGCVQ